MSCPKRLELSSFAFRLPRSLQLASVVERCQSVRAKLTVNNTIDYRVRCNVAVKGHLRSRGKREPSLNGAAGSLNTYDCGIGGRIVETYSYNGPERTLRCDRVTTLCNSRRALFGFARLRRSLGSGGFTFGSRCFAGNRRSFRRNPLPCNGGIFLPLASL